MLRAPVMLGVEDAVGCWDVSVRWMEHVRAIVQSEEYTASSATAAVARESCSSAHCIRMMITQLLYVVVTGVIMP